MKKYLENRIAELNIRLKVYKNKGHTAPWIDTENLIKELKQALEYYNQQQQLSSDAEEAGKQAIVKIIGVLDRNGNPDPRCVELWNTAIQWANIQNALQEVEDIRAGKKKGMSMDELLESLSDKSVPVSTDVEVLAEQYAINKHPDNANNKNQVLTDELYKDWLDIVKADFIAGYQARVAQEGIAKSCWIPIDINNIPNVEVIALLADPVECYTDGKNCYYEPKFKSYTGILTSIRDIPVIKVREGDSRNISKTFYPTYARCTHYIPVNALQGRILSEEEIDQMVEDKHLVKSHRLPYRKGLIDMQNKLMKNG